jgi:hypothetical protein
MSPKLPSSVGRGIFYIYMAAIAWGTGGAAAVVLYDISGMGPVAVSFWRFASGVLLLAVGHLAVVRRTAVPVRGRWRQVVTTLRISEVSTLNSDTALTIVRTVPPLVRSRNRPGGGCGRR